MRAGRATISCPLVTAHMPTFMPATDESTHVPPIGLAKFSLLRLLRNDLYDKCAGIEAWLLMGHCVYGCDTSNGQWHSPPRTHTRLPISYVPSNGFRVSAQE